MDLTEAVLVRMAREKPHTHLMDGGIIHGYAYERNRRRDFQNEPDAVLLSDVEYKTNFIRHCINTLKYSPEMSEKFYDFIGDKELNHTEAERFAESLGSKIEEAYFSFHEAHLMDQEFKFWKFWDGVTYIILTIHGGCSEEWGWSSPHVFEVTHESFNQWYLAEIHCSNCKTSWEYLDFEWTDSDTGEKLYQGEPETTEEGLICPKCKGGYLKV